MENIIEQKIKQMFPKLFADAIGDFGTLKPSTETHNGVNSPKIDSYNINTANNQGFVFGTSSSRVNFQYDPATDTIVLIENPPNTVSFDIGSFKDIGILAGGTDVTDAISLLFTNAPKVAGLQLKASSSLISYTTGVGSNISSLNLSSGDANIRVNNGTSAGNVELTPNLLDISATAGQPFAVWLPNANTLPSPQPGMIAYDGTNFRGVDSSGTWKTFQLL